MQPCQWTVKLLLIRHSQLLNVVLRLKRGALAFVVRSLGAACSFGLTVLLTRLLGATQAGHYLLSFTLVSIIGVLGTLGVDTTVLRYSASNSALGQWGAVRSLWAKSVYVTLLGSGFGAILLFLTAPLLAQSVFTKPEICDPLRLLALAVIPMATLSLHSELLKGLDQILASQVLQTIATPALTFVIVLFLGTFGARGVAWSHVLSATLAAIVALGFCLSLSSHFPNRMGDFAASRLLQTSFPILASVFLGLAMRWSSVVTLAVCRPSADVAIFSAATRTATVTSLVLVAINSVVAPKFAGLYSTGRTAELAATARTSLGIALLCSAPALILFLLYPTFVLAIFGPEFDSGATALVILSLGQVVNVATGPAGYLLMMTGNEKSLLTAAVVATILNLALNAVVTPAFGITGAALATAVSGSVHTIFAAYFVWTKLSLPLYPQFSRASAASGR
ncbi:MAG: oligosaccharide flippase family protein [Armatimonadota bacterium]